MPPLDAKDRSVDEVVPVADDGSFKDPAGRVYRIGRTAGGHRNLRGLNQTAATVMAKLLAMPFFSELRASGHVVDTALLAPTDPDARRVMEEGWSAVAEHEPMDFLTWPYEWPFSMLKEAALLQLRLLEVSARHGWMLKDATPFNVQWQGARPVFIDVPSFIPWEDSSYWRGYRQFCATFLTPLLLTAHLDIPFQPLLRSRLEGIPPEEAVKHFRGLNRCKRGVLSHVWLPAQLERRMSSAKPSATNRGRARRRQSPTMLLALLDSLRRLVCGLSRKAARSDWSRYADSHSYDDADFERKKHFVRSHVAALRPGLTWDLGANIGVFSRIAAEHSGLVIAVDSDQDAVELLYRKACDDKLRNIVPLVMDLANLSPGQGWAGRERPAFDNRRHPDLILCLSMIHHLRVSANVPLRLFLDWLRRLEGTALIEFVSRDDEMFQRLLENKQEEYADYNPENFEKEICQRFLVRDRLKLKGGLRELFLLEPASG